MMGELKYFLGFQIKQLQEGTFISQTKYIQDILNKFGMKYGKPIVGTLKQGYPLLQYEDAVPARLSLVVW
jgi:hypothetical protein